MRQNDQKGFAILLALVFIVFFTLMTLMLSTALNSENRFAVFDRNRMNADFAAQAGAKIAVNYIRTLLDAKTPAASINGSFSGKLSTKTGSAQYSVAYQPDNTSNPSRIQVTATGTSNNTNTTARVEVRLRDATIQVPDPGVINLINNTHDFSNNEEWTVTGSPPNQICRPPASSSRSFKQALFHESLDSNFRLSYNITLDKKNKFDTNPASGTGYGIYYNATGNANNMTAYVFQYDPGAYIGSDGGAFFVKKVIASRSSTTNPWENETRNYTLGFQDNGTDSLGNDRDTTRMSIGNATTSGTFIKTMNDYYTAMNAQNKKRIDGTAYPETFFLTTEDARNYYKPAAKGTPVTEEETALYAPSARHTITIEVKDDETATPIKYDVTKSRQVAYQYDTGRTEKVWTGKYDKKGRKIYEDRTVYETRYRTETYTETVTEPVILKRHYVSCDGKEILKFVDLDRANPIPTTNSCSGLRVWNAGVTFNNNPGESYGQKVTQAILWINPYPSR